MNSDTTVRLSKNLVTLMKHLAIANDTSLKKLMENVIRNYVNNELSLVKQKNPLLYAVLMAEEVDPTPDELKDLEEIESDKLKGINEKSYTLDEVKKEFGLS